MTYKLLEQMTNGLSLPVAGVTEANEPVIVARGMTEDHRKFFRITVAQDNDWLKVVTFWEDGTAEETYEK